MQPRKVIFPDTVPLVAAACRAAAPGATVVAKRPLELVKGTTYVQYRPDSGPETGFLKEESYGINCWAPTLRAAMDTLRRVQAEVRSNLPNTGLVRSASGGAGPFEVVDAPDAVDSHAHAYATVRFTVKGTNY